MKIRPLIPLVIPSIYLFVSPITYALTPEQYQEQRSEALREQQIPDPLVNIDTTPYQVNTSQNEIDNEQMTANDICFNIESLYISGEEVDQFGFAIAPYLSGQHSIIGSCMTANDINQLVSKVQNQIIEKGYITTRVLVQNQNLRSGDLILSLIPGRVDQIIASNVSANRPIYTDNVGNPANFAPAVPIQSGDLLNVRNIEQALENFKRVPTAEADFSIAPSTRINAPGYSDILISWQQDRQMRLSASLDDSGQESTGEYQGNITVSFDNPTWHNDLLYLSYGHSLDNMGDDDDNDSWSYNLGYTFPINNTQFILTHGGYNYDQTVAGANQDYTYSGESYNTDLNISHLVDRNSHSKTYLQGGVFHKQQRNYIDDTEVEVQRRRTSGYKAGIGYETSLGQAQIISDLMYQRGTGAFDAMTPPEALFNEGSARTGILKTNMNIRTPFSISEHPFNYTATIRGQYAEEALIPNDRFSIGGRYTVRGFDGGRSLSGDHGALIRQEISTNFGDSLHGLYVGVDAGYVEMDNAYQDDLLLGHHLVGGVIGVKGRISPPININYNLFTSYPLDQPESFSDEEWVSGFSLGWQH